ncbi:MAG TPA: response regulator [Oligoflexus sp.]|uniref:response regulator transcription factor n=1 Tax=Oligoflexus sp. TaxID=1971216 RepID=UPI002D809C1E|nr:response regulator [Oligoflexus sp.]HET9236193.1 response regulator [Oligoflexus sp.]
MTAQHKILVVEDSLVLRDIESLQLRKAGFQTLACETGETCLQILNQDKTIDAVLLDIELPGISGLEVLTKIRQTSSILQLPVIMATGKTDTETTVQALRLGANDYVTKPVDFDIAQSRLRTHLQLRDLSTIQEKMKKAEAVRALITTYNHEINNALMIATGTISRGLDGMDRIRFEKLTQSLDRIADIVKRLQEASGKDLEMTTYVEGTKMLKI